VRILVAEDDDRHGELSVAGLTESGHIVDRVVGGETALAMALEGIYEAIVLDGACWLGDGLASLVGAPARARSLPHAGG